MTALYVLVVISLLASISTIVMMVVLNKNKKSSDVSLKDIQDENVKVVAHLDNVANSNNTQLSSIVQSQIAVTNNQANFFKSSIDKQDEKLERLREDMNKNIIAMKDDNARQLEKMRETVDEKLNETLEKRFNQSFKIVNDRLEELNRSFMELQSLQNGVADLNKVFKNVKTRGTWGEVSLDNLLSQILVPEKQYTKQQQVKKGSLDRVDFAIRMPGNEKEVFLPIDAKFPTTDYERLQDASEKGDTDGIELAIKALIARVKDFAKSINEKYIVPPTTTDFAIMYVPTEGIYAEIVKREGIVDEIQNKYKVVICGPTTIAALLNSLQMGFRSVAMEKQSAEIAKLMVAFTEDFTKFTVLLKQAGDRIDKVKDSIENAEKRTGYIQKKLSKVAQLSGETAPDVAALLESTEDVTFDNTDYDN